MLRPHRPRRPECFFYLIEWRVLPTRDGGEHGFWCCPTPDCDGAGFGFDIFPTDPNYFDEELRWVYCPEEDRDDGPEGNGFHEGGPERPPETGGGDEDVPWWQLVSLLLPPQPPADLEGHPRHEVAER